MNTNHELLSPRQLFKNSLKFSILILIFCEIAVWYQHFIEMLIYGKLPNPNVNQSQYTIALLAGWFGIGALMGLVHGILIGSIFGTSVGAIIELIWHWRVIGADIYIIPASCVSAIILGLGTTGASLEITQWYKIESLDNLEKYTVPNKNSTTITQPEISEITLINNQDYLEIIFPMRGLNSDLFRSLLSIIVFASIIYLQYLPNYIVWLQLSNLDDWIVNRNINLFCSTFIIIITIIPLPKDLLTAIKQVRLRIDSENISYSNEAFGKQIKPSFIITRADISELKLVNNLDSTNTKDKSSRLYLDAGNKKIEIDKINKLSKSELSWLADEIESFLQTEIVISSD